MATNSRKRDRRDNAYTDTTELPNASVDESFFQSLVDPDFEELARQIPSFGVAWRRVVADTHRGTASTAIATAAHMTPECSVALCQALLRVYFGIVLTHVPFLANTDSDTDSDIGRTVATPMMNEIHLCPPVPNRFFYVRWIQNEILPRGEDPAYFISPACATIQNDDLTVRGLDIGTGAVAIYPFLMISSWSKAPYASRKPQHSILMHATDIDESSVESARTNIQGNTQLRHRIHVWHVPASDRQLQHEAWSSHSPTGMAMDKGTINIHDIPGSQVDSLFPVGPLRRSIQHIGTATNTPHVVEPLAFAMTNPPFYDLDEYATIQQQTSKYRSRRHQHPSLNGTEQEPCNGPLRTTMTKYEGSYPGGEVGFGLDMIIDGLYLFLQHRQYHLDSSSSVASPTVSPSPPPIWTSTMCGKKSSLVQLQHVVTQLLGPAHVCRTEFGPGQLTRWFLAWTFQRPVARSPLARLSPWSFNVPIPSLNMSQSSDEVLDRATVCCREIVSRIGEYGRTSHFACDVGPPVVATSNRSSSPLRVGQTLQLRDASVALPPWKDDHALPGSLQRILGTMDPTIRVEFLPPEGHFILDVQVEVAASGIAVQIQPYQHSTHGRMIIEKVKSQLESEVCRTNRRWRRRQQREEQAPQAMDDST